MDTVDWTKDDGDGVARQMEKRKTPEKIYGCSKRRHGGGRCKRGGG